VMMVAEIAGGTIFGSMALVADGWHMSTHAAALSISAFAYSYARRHARAPQFAFGTGKVGDLAGFASAIVLAMVALFIGWQSVERLIAPAAIETGPAIAVAGVGLAVNLLSAWLLSSRGADHHHHNHNGHGHAGHHGDARAHGHDDDAHAAHGHDNNLRSAYLHVLADALTSVLAIVALLATALLGWVWADPVMGIAGALVIARWSWGLVRDSGGVLIDRVPDQRLFDDVRAAIEAGDDRITDLHLWQVGSGHYAAILSVVSHQPLAPEAYKARLARLPRLSHVTVEVQACR
jgi:cation diffusion facilitator family transporter